MSELGVRRGPYKHKEYKQMRTSKAKHIMPNGDIIKARQDFKNHELWYLEIYRHGEQVSCLKVEVNADNCHRLFELLQSWEPKASNSKGGNTGEKYSPSIAPFYKLHWKGRR